MKLSSYFLFGAALLLAGNAASAQDSDIAIGTATINYDVHIDAERDFFEQSGNPELTRGQVVVVDPTSPDASKFIAVGDSKDKISFTFPSSFNLELGSPFDPQLPGVTPDGTQSIVIVVNNIKAMSGTYSNGPAPANGNGNGPGNPNANPNNNGVGPQGNGGGWTPYISGTTVPLNGPIGLPTSGIGRRFLWVGGTFNVAPNQQRGVYTGYLTVAVDYQN
jgi:hypothetical protein